MIAPAELARFDSHLRCMRAWGTLDKLPTFVPPVDLLPPSAPAGALPPLRGSYDEHKARMRVRAARVYAHQQSALDAPFAELKKQQWQASQGQATQAPPRALARGGCLGLVSNATSDTKGIADASGPVREKIKINRSAQRIKRMRTAVGHAARLLHFDAHSELAAQRWNKKFITLTYRQRDGWRPGHFTSFRKALREWCVRRKVRCRFVWVAELQGRGAVHYHVVVWLPKGKFLPFADAQGWWPHGATNIKTAQSPISYIAKYASKTMASDVHGYPRGARMHGAGGLDVESRRHIRYWQAPFWVRDALSGRADIRKVTGGYMDRFTGEFLPSPWRVCIGPDGEPWAYRVDQQETMQ